MSAIGAYFAKKRWNPGNLKNVEDVWKKEQAKKEEERKLDELRREYEEDRNREALEELQVKAGVRKSSARLGWMYDAGPSSTSMSASNRSEIDAQEREAFLLGEKSIDQAIREPKVNIKRGDAINSFQSSSTTEPTFSSSESFIRARQDPLFMIKKRQSELGISDDKEEEEEEEGKKKKKHKKKKETERKKNHQVEKKRRESIIVAVDLHRPHHPHLPICQRISKTENYLEETRMMTIEKLERTNLLKIIIVDVIDIPTLKRKKGGKAKGNGEIDLLRPKEGTESEVDLRITENVTKLNQHHVKIESERNLGSNLYQFLFKYLVP